MRTCHEMFITTHMDDGKLRCCAIGHNGMQCAYPDRYNVDGGIVCRRHAMLLRYQHVPLYLMRKQERAAAYPDYLVVKVEQRDAG